MNRLNIHALGINIEHTTDFVINRRNGFSEQWFLMVFSTPFEVLTVNGLERGEIGDCVIHTPQFHHYHRSVAEAKIGFINSWIHCSGSLIKKLVEKYDLPVNAIITTCKQDAFLKYFTAIQSELLKKLPHYHENIQLQFENLLLNISRERIIHSNGSTLTDMYRDVLGNVRSQVLTEYKTNWTVESMANVAKLSIPRFASLYKSAFKISPINDLINIRIKQAQIMLLSTDKTIEQIAFECGFSSLYYFSRIFKKRVGVSPRAFKF